MKRHSTERTRATAIVLLAAMLAAGGAFGAGLDGLELLREGRSMRSSSADPNWRDGNGDARPIPPGETLVIADLEGPGVIQHIWNTVAAEDRGYARLLLVRMYWDGEDEPPVALSAGEHVLTVRNVGSSADGGGCYFGIDGWLQHRHE